MNNFPTLYKKELKNYLYTPTNFIFIALFGLINNWLFFQNFFLIQQATLNQFFDNLPFLLLFLIPALSMSLLSEEKKKGTWEILLSLPINEIEIILAKFFAGLSLIFFALLTTISSAITVFLLGNPDFGLIASGYLGALWLSASYLSLGIFISGLINQQTAAFFISFVVLFINDLFNQEFFLMKLPFQIKNFFEFLSLRSHYEEIATGLLTGKSLWFFISWITIFLSLAYIRLKKK